MGNVTKLPRFTLTGSELYDKLVIRIRKAGWDAIAKRGDTVKDIAARAGVGERTVERFIWGETINPWAQTVFRVAEALDFTAADLIETPARQRA